MSLEKIHKDSFCLCLAFNTISSVVFVGPFRLISVLLYVVYMYAENAIENGSLHTVYCHF